MISCSKGAFSPASVFKLPKVASVQMLRLKRRKRRKRIADQRAKRRVKQRAIREQSEFDDKLEYLYTESESVGSLPQ